MNEEQVHEIRVAGVNRPQDVHGLRLLPDRFPDLTSGPFVLRQILPTDAPDWHSYLSDQRVYEHTSAPVMTVQDIEGLIGMFTQGFLAKTQIRWALCERDRGNMIGDLGFNTFHQRDRRAEIGYGLAPDFWRRGVMTAALSALISYGFADLDLNKIEATVSVENQRSSGLLRKLGFQYEGTIRDYRNRRGVFGDSWWFGLLRREWNPVSG